MPNSLAYAALLAWPLVTVALFRLLPLERALIWSLVAGYLLLPPATSFDFPMVPPLDKIAIPSLATFAVCVLMLGKRVPLLPASPLGRLLMVLFVVGPVATVLTNPDPILFETSGGLPGLRIYDAVSAVVNQAIFVLPFFLARRFLAEPSGAARDPAGADARRARLLDADADRDPPQPAAQHLDLRLLPAQLRADDARRRLPADRLSLPRALGRLLHHDRARRRLRALADHGPGPAHALPAGRRLSRGAAGARQDLRLAALRALSRAVRAPRRPKAADPHRPGAGVRLGRLSAPARRRSGSGRGDAGTGRGGRSRPRPLARRALRQRGGAA